MQPWRINSTIECTTKTCCNHLLFISQQNVTVGCQFVRWEYIILSLHTNWMNWLFCVTCTIWQSLVNKTNRLTWLITMNLNKIAVTFYGQVHNNKLYNSIFQLWNVISHESVCIILGGASNIAHFNMLTWTHTHTFSFFQIVPCFLSFSQACDFFIDPLSWINSVILFSAYVCLWQFLCLGFYCANKLFCFTVFRAALFGPFRSWLSDVLGVELQPTVDISCARYEYTGELTHETEAATMDLDFYDLIVMFFFFQDVLLCHDDELEGRRVAFILYLVPPWQSCDGGTLDLYSTDSEPPCQCVSACKTNRSLWYVSSLSSGNYQPQSLVKSLVPSWNTLVLFEVSPVSYHQVREKLWV